MGDASNCGRKKGGSAEILGAQRSISERYQFCQGRDKTFRISYFGSHRAPIAQYPAEAKVALLPFLGIDIGRPRDLDALRSMQLRTVIWEKLSQIQNSGAFTPGFWGDDFGDSRRQLGQASKSSST
jgi:hypothetical protein